MIPPGIEMLHRPVSALVRAYGAPRSVATKDDGQHIDFGDASATVGAIVDDDATIHALDLAFPPGTAFALDIEGTRHTLTFGRTTSLAARDELAADAETDGGDFRVFRLGVESALVLVFDRKTALLSHLIAGDRETILRLGYLTDPTPTQQRFPYTAPVLKHSEVNAGLGTRATVLRIDLNRGGAVQKVAIVVPSDDAAFDAQLAARVARDAYVPAMLGGRAIGASVLREVHH